MSLRVIFVLLSLGILVAGCRPNPMAEGLDGSFGVAGDNGGFVEHGFVHADGGSDLAGSVDGEEIISQAHAANYDPAIAASDMTEDEIIAQATTAHSSYPHHEAAASVHRVHHTPDVAMQEIRQHQPYLLDSGDRVRVFIYGQPNLSRTYIVDGGGFISVPLIGTVRARNLTTYALENAIGDLLAADYVKDPKVSIQITQHRPFFILGEVRRAGQYPFVNSMTARTAIAIAGGFSERAYERSVKLTRIINGYRTTVEVAPHEPVYPGDTIHVRERFF